MHVPSDGFTFRLSLNLRRIPAGSAAGLPLPRASKTPSGCKPVGRRTYLCSYDSSSWVTALIHVRTFRPRLPGSTACRLKLCQRGSGGRNLSRVQKKVSFPTSRNPVLRSQVEWSLEKCGRLDGDRSSSSSSKISRLLFFAETKKETFILQKKFSPLPFLLLLIHLWGYPGPACLSECARVAPSPFARRYAGSRKKEVFSGLSHPHTTTPLDSPPFFPRASFLRERYGRGGEGMSLSLLR